jgi:hypothetical protein
MFGKAYHEVMGNNTMKTYVTYEETVSIPYTSWQEEGNPIFFNDTPIHVFQCNHRYIYEPSMDAMKM